MKLFQCHIAQETANLPNRSDEHRPLFAKHLQKFAKTGERWLGNKERGPWVRD
jgi:hypothetical protein